MICSAKHARRAGSLAHIKKHSNAEKLECLSRSYAILIDEETKIELADEDDSDDIDVASFVDEEEFMAVTEGVEGTCCPTCEKPFPNVSQCKAHFATHVTDGAFKCLLCLSRYSRKAGCRDHIKQKHTAGERRMALERLDDLKFAARQVRIAKKVVSAPAPKIPSGADRASSTTPPWTDANSDIPQQQPAPSAHNPYEHYGYPDVARSAESVDDEWEKRRKVSNHLFDTVTPLDAVAVAAAVDANEPGSELVWIDESLMTDFLNTSGAVTAKRRSIARSNSVDADPAAIVGQEVKRGRVSQE